MNFPDGMQMVLFVLLVLGAAVPSGVVPRSAGRALESAG